MDMFYCTLTLCKSDYKKVKNIKEVKNMATETYNHDCPKLIKKIYPDGSLDLVELCNYTGNIMPAESILQKLRIPYVAFLDKTDDGPALERLFDGKRVQEKEVD